MLSAAILASLLVLLVWLFSLIIKEQKYVRKLSASWDGKESPPAISILKLLWRFVYKGKNVSNALLYMGEVNPVVRVKLFILNAVVINDFAVGRAAFRKSVFSGKSSQDTWCYPTRGTHGIMNSHGKKWEEQRKFCLRNLRNFGFGTRSMESLIQTEVRDFIGNLSNEKDGALISPNEKFYLPVLNSIWMILTGERSANEDGPLFQMTIKLYHAFMRAIEFPELVVVFLPFKLTTIQLVSKWLPFVKMFFPGLPLFHQATEELRNYCQQLIESRQKSLTQAWADPCDLVDIYLNKIESTTDPKSEFFKEKGTTNLLGVMTEIFLAGGDTTATMLQWNLLHLIRNPEMQQKIQREIEGAVGDSRCPTLDDRSSCPYTEAFMEEVLRYNPVSKASLPHETVEDTFIENYFIPKGTTVFLNIENIHRDPKIWGDPDTFRPDRFLSPDGSNFVKHEAMVAFSIGRRKCLGERLARDNMFLFVTSICQRFTLKKDPQLKGRPGLIAEVSGVHTPKKFSMIIRDRWAVNQSYADRADSSTRK